MTKKSRCTLSYTIAIVVLIASLAAMLIMRNNANIAEWWTMNISRHWASATSTVASLVKFSIFEWFIIFAIVIGILCVIVGIALLIKRKFRSFINGLLAIAISILVVSNIYIMSAGFSYYRAPLSITNSDEEINYEQALEMYEYYVTDFNALSTKLNRDGQGNVIMPYSANVLISKINAEFDKMDSNYYYSHHAPAKPILNSWLMSLTNILGISFLPTGEANYNNLMPLSDKPHTIVHEIAHQRGVMREGDANTVAEYILINSDDEYLRYCGYYTIMPVTMQFLLINLKEDIAESKQNEELSIAPEILQELLNGNIYWKSIADSGLYTFLSKASSFFNNLYLKANGREDGTGDYDNTGGNVDSGKTDDDGNIIFKYELSQAERMYYQVYLDKVA